MRRTHSISIWVLAFLTAIPSASILNAEELSSEPKGKQVDESADDNEESNIPLAGHSDHGEAYNEGPRQNAYLMGGTGRVDFPISTMNSQAQKFFDQGLGQLYGFWYYEAERSFRRVAAIDPDSAMAYWGMAQANHENEDRAKLFIAEAVEKKDQASERERQYIEALNEMLTDERPEKDKRRRYVRALEKIIRKYPKDIEAKAMLAVHLWQSARSGVPMNSHQAVESLLADIFRVQPMHPAHHFRIHLWDREEPSQALVSAAKCGQSAPTIAHMWHMPGHIYSRLKRYEDAVFQQEASARADHAHMMRDGVLPDQIHNYAHNNEWLIRNLVHLGRKDEALDLAKNMLELPRHPKYNDFDIDGMCSCKYGRRRLLQVLETFEMWDDILKLADTMYLEPTEVKEEQGRRLRYMALAHYHHGDFAEVQSSINELEGLLKAFDEDAKQAGEDAAKKKEEELDEAEADDDDDEPSSDNASKSIKEDSESKSDPVVEPADESEYDKPSEAKEGTKAGETKPKALDSKETEPETLEAEGESPDDSQVSKKDKEKQAAAKKKREKKAADRKKKIEDARKKAEKEAKQGRKSVEKAIAELKGIQFLARGMTDEAIEQFKKSDIAKTRLARYYFLAGDHKKATELCNNAVEGGKNEVLPLANQIDLFRRMGKTEDAKQAFERLRFVAGSADLKTPLLAKLDKFAAELKYPKDWRVPTPTAEDVGKRPRLDSLGPFRWAPSQATDWELLDHEQNSVALGDYRGRPVVVIFYLGAGCLHCVEQLHEFSPKLPEFHKAGVEVVAISMESSKEIAEALKDFSDEGDFPIRLLANPQLDVFKQYRAFDDFEDMPLHGTFLLDAKGKIRWHDISYEPFLKPDFLLKEAQRILPPAK